ncbi:Lrp/AsnC family transcriptional regulator [Oceanobacillus polygoni]|uniref:DNA-binding Lrp family transcriptional regulator n=1 Tax=Oceanobacillus polygoni TaxID=1235259 RepID=A0A9X1CCZ6_9BACI|nr:Lrp/AsnC family transcriptional regulator [Oceanobacillus polygoni]MBP2079284.1 DNA-binding Lrp family transcriptional regulator [Oceanobacillus polygoni]
MKLTNEELNILSILEESHHVSTESIAMQLGTSVGNVQKVIKKLEKEKVIVSYPTLIDWNKIEGKETIVAMIDVKVTPERGVGFDEVAEQIYRYPEVQSLYLMSGTYDLSVTIEGKTMNEIAAFVSNKLATIENVVSTTSHFMLKRYKHDSVIIEGNDDKDRRMVITP